MPKTSCEVFFPNKPRLLFILLGIEHPSALPFLFMAIHRSFQYENIFWYKVWEHMDIPNTSNLYNSWFTDIMMKKGSSTVVVIVHDENMKDFSTLIDARMQAFHSIYNYKIAEEEFRRSHRIFSEEHPFNPMEYRDKFADLPMPFWEMFKCNLDHCLVDTYAGCLQTITCHDYSDLKTQVKLAKTLG